MDQIAPVLSDLTKFNKLSGTARQITRSIIKIIGNSRPITLKLLDIGTGSGDVLCEVTRQLSLRGVIVDAVGVDMNPVSVEYAATRAKVLKSPVKFQQYDALDAANSLDYDIIISSLFLHHLDESDLRALFSSIASHARLGMVMNDLERSLLGYNLTWIVTHALSRSYIIRQDGLTSVKGAFKKNEMVSLLQSSGLQKGRVNRAFPARLMINWKKDS